MASNNNWDLTNQNASTMTYNGNVAEIHGNLTCCFTHWRHEAWLGNSQTKPASIHGKVIDLWTISQQTMFDYSTQGL